MYKGKHLTSIARLSCCFLLFCVSHGDTLEHTLIFFSVSCSLSYFFLLRVEVYIYLSLFSVFMIKIRFFTGFSPQQCPLWLPYWWASWLGSRTSVWQQHCSNRSLCKASWWPPLFWRFQRKVIWVSWNLWFWQLTFWLGRQLQSSKYSWGN